MSKKHKKKFRRMEGSNNQAPITFTPPASRSSEFNPDYSYVIKDLKRIGFLAGFFLIVLVVLAFILR